MIYIKDWNGPMPNGKSIACIGNFDGVHLGHQYLLGQAKMRARATGSYLTVITFFPHTRAVINPAASIRYLTLPEERAQLLEVQGIDLLVELTFDHAMASLGAAEFIDMLRDHVDLLELWVGQGFALGRQREGTVPKLRELSASRGFAVVECSARLMDGRPVSSTRIRRALADGTVGLAAQLLGRPYEIRGLVVQGEGRGRALGIPTANLAYDPLKAVPKNGVYAVWAQLQGSEYRLPAVANLGQRPTFDASGVVLEVHIMDFNRDLYGTSLSVHFIERIRDEIKFPNAHELVNQIRQDILRARALLSAAQ